MSNENLSPFVSEPASRNEVERHQSHPVIGAARTLRHLIHQVALVDCHWLGVFKPATHPPASHFTDTCPLLRL